MENKWTPISIAFLAVSILVSSIYVGNSLKSQKETNSLPANMNITTSKSEDMLNLPEAAAFLKVAPATVADLVTYSKNDDLGIPYFKVEGELRFSKKALGEWLVKIANHKYEF